MFLKAQNQQYAVLDCLTLNIFESYIMELSRSYQAIAGKQQCRPPKAHQERRFADASLPPVQASHNALKPQKAGIVKGDMHLVTNPPARSSKDADPEIHPLRHAAWQIA